MKQVMKKEACLAKFEIFGIGKFNKTKPFYVKGTVSIVNTHTASV